MSKLLILGWHSTQWLKIFEDEMSFHKMDLVGPYSLAYYYHRIWTGDLSIHTITGISCTLMQSLDKEVSSFDQTQNMYLQGLLVSDHHCVWGSK